MSRWAVDPAEVRAGGAGVRSAGDDVADMAGGVARALSMVSAAGGDAGVAEAALSASRRWGTALDGLGSGTSGLGAAAVAAAQGYQATEREVAVAFGEGHE